jgi:hypothetical protein
MIKKISLAIGIGFFALVGVVSAGGNNKVAMCHKTGSEKNPMVLISVSEKAVPAQLAQGSVLATEQLDGSYTCNLTPPPPPPQV